MEDVVIELEEEWERLEVNLKKILISNNTEIESNVNNLEIYSKNESFHKRLTEIPFPKFSDQYQD